MGYRYLLGMRVPPEVCMVAQEALGAQYRDAKDAIGVHRIRQARAEVAYAASVRSKDSAAITAARAAVDRAVADVEWCRAVAVAAGEAYKGEPLADVMARNAAHRGK
jgi:hypothetical protein